MAPGPVPAPTDSLRQRSETRQGGGNPGWGSGSGRPGGGVVPRHIYTTRGYTGIAWQPWPGALYPPWVHPRPPATHGVLPGTPSPVDRRAADGPLGSRPQIALGHIYSPANSRWFVHGAPIRQDYGEIKRRERLKDWIRPRGISNQATWGP